MSRVRQYPFCSFLSVTYRTPESYVTVTILPKPTSFSEPKSEFGESDDIRGRSLHFLDGGSKLLVSYLNHGIVYGFLNG